MESGDTFALVPGLESLVLVVMNVTAFKDQGHLTFTLKAVPVTAKMVVMLQAQCYL
jgi:hypothetical protein